ncbi:helix-turn-helix domain-containing protein [Streptomyces sp. NPDC059918]|uniref:helix-turn-helix domain-containing protein n=1 Tax=unclassified Streptomyces TaxID=2593676 RepID=UPI0036679B12
MTESVEEPRLPSPKERRRLREAAGLSYEAVATAVGVRASTVRSWESDRTSPRGRKREAYAAFLRSLTPAAEAPGAASPGGPAPAGPAAGAPATAPADAPAAPEAPEAPEAPAAPEAPMAPAASAGSAAPAGSEAPAAPVAAPAAAPAARGSVPPSAEAGTAGAADGLAPRVPGVMRPFGMTGHEERTRPPVAAGRAAEPPTALPRHEAGFTVQATARAIGTPGRGSSVPVAEPAPAGATTAGTGGLPDGPAPAPDTDATAAPRAPRPPGPGAVFDALYQYAAPALARQAYLLTGRRGLAHEAVERAFQLAWARWPEVAADPDPVGWVRAAAYEYALSPWHGFRRAHKHPDKAPAAPADRILMDAMLALPPAHRRTVLLYDGVGLDLPDTAAETEATTPTTGNRLLHAHATLADRIPELAAAPPEKQSAMLRERLGAVVPAVPLEPRPAATVRMAAEYRATRWTRVFLGLTAVIAVATAYTTATAPRQYEPPIAPGASVSGVPPLAGPQRLTDETRQLRERLRAHPAHRPERIAPSLE